MKGDTADFARLRRIFADTEPAELRTYLAVAAPDRVNHVGSTTPALGQAKQLASGLWVPSTAAASTAPIDLMHVFISFEDLFGTCVTATELASWIGQFAKEELLHALGRVLRVLHDDADLVRQGERAQADLLRPDLAKKLRALLGDDRRALLSRQGAFALAKLAVVFGGSETKSSHTLDNVLGLLFAAIHDHLGGDATEDVNTESATFGDFPVALSASIIANQWFNRSFDEASFLTMYNARWANPDRDSTQRVVAAFRHNMGFDIEDLATVALAAWAGSRSEQSVSFWRSYFGSVGIDASKLEAILAQISIPLDRAATEIQKGELDSETFQWNFDTFERYPILELPDQRLLVLEPAYLVRRCMGWAPIYDLSSARKASEHSLANASEAYAFDILRSLYEGGPEVRIFTDAQLAIMSPTGKRADSAIDFGTSWAVIEVTARRPIRGALHAAGLDSLEQQMDVLLEEIVQIAATANALQTKRHLLTGVPSDGQVKVYPVLIMTEGFPTNPITLSELHRRVDKLSLLNGLNAAPVEVIDLVELEMVEYIAETHGVSLPEILDGKARSNFRFDSVRNYLMSTPGFDPARSNRVSESFIGPINRIAARIGASQIGDSPR